MHHENSRDSSVSAVIMEWTVFIPGKDKRLYFFPNCLDRLRPNSIFNGSLCPGAKWQDSAFGHSPPSNDKMNKDRSCTSTAPYAFMAGTGTTLPEYATK